MKLKSITRKTVILLMLVLIFIFNTGGIWSTDMQGRLRDFLENEHKYNYYPINPLENLYYNNKNKKNSFKDILTGTPYIAFTGTIKSISSNRKEIKVSDNGAGIKIDTSKDAIKGIVGSLYVGRKVTVYGKTDGTELDAEHISVDPLIESPTQKELYYPDKIVDKCEIIDDLAKDKHVSFEVPLSWKNDPATWGRLENNNVGGYQFFLNTMDQNWDVPEFFYIFYFSYKTYLDKPPVNPTTGDHKDIEKKVLANILKDLSGSFDYKLDDIKIQNGAGLDYCLTTYRPADGKHYRLEFTFKPDNNGLVCMLYLYYPEDNTSNHIHEVSYVINSVKN
ncbi:MAG: hypothetical protein IK014_02080 [Lachnospiraceae bacterium]|nr:hypothetical protein [Lachnospiraceae bacterium]